MVCIFAGFIVGFAALRRCEKNKRFGSLRRIRTKVLFPVAKKKRESLETLFMADSATVEGSDHAEKSAREELIKKYAQHPGDTGSTAVQVALITSRVNHLQGHFESHKKDHHSRRGLMKLVGKRRSLLDYLRKQNVQAYRDLIQSLGLRK